MISLIEPNTSFDGCVNIKVFLTSPVTRYYFLGNFIHLPFDERIETLSFKSFDHNIIASYLKKKDVIHKYMYRKFIVFVYAFINLNTL